MERQRLCITIMERKQFISQLWEEKCSKYHLSWEEIIKLSKTKQEWVNCDLYGSHTCST